MGVINGPLLFVFGERNGSMKTKSKLTVRLMILGV